MKDSIRKEIWAFGGGKGGVGKSIVCTNIGLALAQKGYKVTLVDADFGAANLHTCLGIQTSSLSLTDFFRQPNLLLQDISIPTSYSNLSLICGAHDSFKISNIGKLELDKLMKALHSLDDEYILVDLGAGTVAHTVDMFLQADKGIVVCMPEPTSIENTYRFIKYALYRKLELMLDFPEVRAYLEELAEDKQNVAWKTPAILLYDIFKLNEAAGNQLRKLMQNFNLKLVLNQVRSQPDMQLGFSMVNSCLKYFGIRIAYTGFIESEDSILRSAKVRQPALQLSPNSSAALGINQIAENLRNNHHTIHKSS